MNGAMMTAQNQTADEGRQNPEDQSFTYQGQYPLSAELFKKMRKTPLDKVRIAWGSGYEDYDVQFVQLLVERARCF